MQANRKLIDLSRNLLVAIWIIIHEMNKLQHNGILFFPLFYMLTLNVRTLTTNQSMFCYQCHLKVPIIINRWKLTAFIVGHDSFRLVHSDAIFSISNKHQCGNNVSEQSKRTSKIRRFKIKSNNQATERYLATYIYRPQSIILILILVFVPMLFVIVKIEIVSTVENEC